MTSQAQPTFGGVYADLLNELRELIDHLWTEYGVSFVKAGDDRVYAFGGDGYVVVLDEMKWNGSIEFLTPGSTLTIKPAENGQFSIVGSNQDEAANRHVLREGIDGLRKYYGNRYWSTPKKP
ncbi:MAG TPA: hypothetical protein VJH03_03445 [Blastocatellia bacterium]|nr:hypothetical protein [Blastocatellia bacterium]